MAGQMNPMNKTVTPPRTARPMDLSALSDQAHAATALLKALAHDARLMILCRLIEGEKTVSELEVLVGLRQPAVSQQLARLRADNLVSARRDGKNIHYSIARNDVRAIIAALHEEFCPA
jgi:DNA-binding transcriptional ArsR family regulator